MRLTLTTKIGLLLILPFAGSLAGVLTFASYLERTRTHGHFINVAGRQRMLSAELRDWAHMVSLGQDEGRAGLRSRVEDFQRALVALERGGEVLEGTVDAAPPELQPELASVASLWSELRPDLLAVAETPRGDAGFVEAYRRVDGSLPKLRNLSHRVVVAFEAIRQRQRREILWTLGFLTGANGVVLLVGLFLSRRYIVGPVLGVENAARRIRGGDFSQRLDVSTRDEIGTLARTFNEMSEQVERLLGALDLRRKHAETVIASVPAWLLLLREDLTVLRVNRSFCEAFGLDQSAIAGKRLTDLLPADGLREAAGEVLAGGEPKRGLYLQMPWKDGKRFLRVAIAGIRLAEEEAAEEEERLLVVVEDLSTEQRLADLARQSERQLHEVIEHATDGIVMMGTDGLVSCFNRAAEQMFGYRRDAVLGRPLTMLIPEAYRGAHENGLARLLATEKAKVLGQLLQLEGLRQDGSTFPIELTVSDYRTDGEIVFTGVLRDITERRQFEAQLRQSQKMEVIGQLAGGVAHDFNNLLTAISGYTDFILAGLSATDPLRLDAEQVKTAADRAAALTSRLLAFSRKQALQPTALDLNALVADVEKMLRRLIGEDVKLATVVDPRLGSVNADPAQIEQVIMNLAVNARDAMPRGGALTIETANVELDQAYARAHLGSTPGSYVRLAVRDTGCGMDAETRAHIFEPFFTTKGPGKGTGLGLAMVYGIVKQSGGYITFDSAPGQGTTFTIYLPRVETPAETLQVHRPPTATARGTETILLAEDEDAVRALVGKILQLRGYTVLEARDGGEALSIAEQHAGPIHLIVTDMVMPGMSGLDLVKRLAFVRPETKVIYMSGYAEHAVLQEGVLDSGAAFLRKPFALDALARQVREVLDSGAGQKAAR